MVLLEESSILRDYFSDIFVQYYTALRECAKSADNQRCLLTDCPYIFWFFKDKIYPFNTIIFLSSLYYGKRHNILSNKFEGRAFEQSLWSY